MYRRLSYFLPKGALDSWRREVLETAAHICLWPLNTSILERVKNEAPGAELWASMSPGMVFCKTGGGRYQGRIPWRADQIGMPDPMFTTEIFSNQDVPGILHLDPTGRWYPDIMPADGGNGAIACNLKDLPRLRRGPFAGLHAIEAYALICRRFLAAHSRKLLAGIHFDVSPRTMGVEADLAAFEPLASLFPEANRVSVNATHNFPVYWPRCFGLPFWATGRKIEGGPWTAPRGEYPRDENDLFLAMYAGTPSMPTLGLKAAPPRNTVWHCQPRYRFQAADEEQIRLAVGIFCLAMTNPVEEEVEPEPGEVARTEEVQHGPWLSMHDTYWGDTAWPGIYAPEREELRTWTGFRALSEARPLGPSDDLARIFVRDFEDDGGQRYRLGVSLATRAVTGYAPRTATMVRTSRPSGLGS